MSTTRTPNVISIDRSPSAVLRRRAFALLLVPVLLAVALVLPACGSDEPASGTITVRATDFSFGALPAEVEAGTTFELVNEAEEELHEFVAFKLPEDESRSVDELIDLPREELDALLGAGPPPADAGVPHFHHGMYAEITVV